MFSSSASRHEMSMVSKGKKVHTPISQTASLFIEKKRLYPPVPRKATLFREKKRLHPPISRKAFLFKKKKRLDPPATATPKILDLPVELIQFIIEHLELHDGYLLSQVCRAMRRLIRNDWKRLVTRHLTYLERLDFFNGIALILPNHWVCAPCGQLHRINVLDLPKGERLDTPHCQVGEGRRLQWPYNIRETHVQLALKLSRLGNSNESYLRDIMSPFTSSIRTRFPNSLQRYYRATPKIINGKFLLQVEWDFYDKGASIPVAHLCETFICPHMRITRVPPVERYCSYPRCHTHGPSYFEDHVILAFSAAMRGQEVTGHCERCPTDYALKVETGMVTIRAWYDFGSEKSPIDKEWTVHVGVERSNIESGGLVVPHAPGSVRKMYVGKKIRSKKTKHCGF